MQDDKISFDTFLKSENCLPEEPRQREKVFRDKKHGGTDASFIILAIVAAISIALCIMYYNDVFVLVDDDYTLFMSGTSSQGESIGEKVNINTASVETLCTLKYIGKRKAHDIVAYRIANGPFEKIDDIKNVKNISNGIFDKIKDSICV